MRLIASFIMPLKFSVQLRDMLAVAILVVFIVSPAHAADLTGTPRIVDGDTLHLNGTKIRLHGIDAPESKQSCTDQHGASYRCGEASTEALRTLIGSEPVRCEGDKKDKYNRVLAVCYANGIDLNAEMVRQGWALAYRRYSKDYVSVEMEAQAAKRGVWAGKFEMPWEWRRGQ